MRKKKEYWSFIPSICISNYYMSGPMLGAGDILEKEGLLKSRAWEVEDM